MKIDVHYYAVLGFCRVCGFDKESACTIAYASQFVDEAKINHMVIDGESLDPLAQDIQNAPFFDLGRNPFQESLLDLQTVLLFEFFPLPGLSGVDEIQRIPGNQAQVTVVFLMRAPAITTGRHVFIGPGLQMDHSRRPGQFIGTPRSSSASMASSNAFSEMSGTAISLVSLYPYPKKSIPILT